MPPARLSIGLAALLAAVSLSACAHSLPAAAPPPSAEAALAALEQRLLDARVLRLRYRARAEGAVAAAVDGELALAPGQAHLSGTGTFAGSPVALRLAAAEGRMEGGSERRTFDEAAPEHLRPALVLGLTRMGILHNLARLSSGRAPDHAGGGVEEWVRPLEAAWADSAEAPARRGIRFGVEVAGQRTAEAVLWLDAAGLPVRRTQVVRFPGGEMNVVEEYELVSLEP